SEDSLGDERPERFTADLLYNTSEDEKTGITVRVARTRGKIERLRRVAIDDIVPRCRHLHLLIDEVERIVVAITRQMTAAIEQRDVFGSRQVGIPLRHRIVERKFSLFGEHQSSSAGKLLGHRSDPEHRL